MARTIKQTKPIKGSSLVWKKKDEKDVKVVLPEILKSRFLYIEVGEGRGKWIQALVIYTVGLHRQKHGWSETNLTKTLKYPKKFRRQLPKVYEDSLPETYEDGKEYIRRFGDATSPITTKQADVKDPLAGVKLLGTNTSGMKFGKPTADILESFPNPNIKRDYKIRHDFAEFTSLCPKTGQPDFAEIEIRYTADKLCVESKSLKLYLFAYRTAGAFMEDITNKIADDIVKAINPRQLHVVMYFKARGGIFTTVEVEHKRKK